MQATASLEEELRLVRQGWVWGLAEKAVLAFALVLVFSFFLGLFRKLYSICMLRKDLQRWKKLAPTLETETGWKPREYNVLFGFIGGLGPKAMNYFLDCLVVERNKLFQVMESATAPEGRWGKVRAFSTSVWTLEEVEKVFLHTKGRKQLLDQDHIPVLVAQATTVPPRPKYILKESTIDPVREMEAVSKGLVAAGATHLAVICNTAHYFMYDVVEKFSNVEFIDMIDLTLQFVARLVGEKKGNVGIYATTATLRTKIYESKMNGNFSFQLVSPLDIQHEGVQSQSEIEKVIFGEHGIKSGYDNVDRSLEARNSLQVLLTESLRIKRSLGVDIIILGCSELPLLLNNESIKLWASKLLTDSRDKIDVEGIRFVDPGMILAHEVLRITLLSRELCKD